MDYTINKFKKFLMDEVKSKSFKSYSEIYEEIENFSRTPDFYITYDKWLNLPSCRINKLGPKHILE